MFSNQIEAIKYFRHAKVKDLLEGSKNSTFNFEEGYFTHLLNHQKAGTCDLVKALQTAKVIEGTYEFDDQDRMTFKDNVDIAFFAERLDKYLSANVATKLSVYLGYDLDEFDPRNPFYMYDQATWYDFYEDIFMQVNNRFGASLLATAKAYFQSEYNPIENYSMEQVETPDITHTKSGNSSETETPDITHTKSGTSSETETPNITETIHTEANSKLKTDGSSSGNVYGFGSSASTPLNEGESSQTTQGSKDDNYTDSERRETGTRSVSGTSGETDKETGTRSLSGSSSETDKETGTRTLTRSGNIGVTTSQQMLQSEIELRKFDFLEEVFKCFDKVICSSVY